MDNHLRISTRVKPVALFLELGAKLREVVDLTVENDPDRTIFIKNGLMAAAQIDDAEAAHAESHTIFDVDALIIRSAMHDFFTHLMDGFFTCSECLIRACDTCNTAHRFSLSRLSRMHSLRHSTMPDGCA